MARGCARPGRRAGSAVATSVAAVATLSAGRVRVRPAGGVARGRSRCGPRWCSRSARTSSSRRCRCSSRATSTPTSRTGNIAGDPSREPVHPDADRLPRRRRREPGRSGVVRRRRRSTDRCSRGSRRSSSRLVGLRAGAGRGVPDDGARRAASARWPLIATTVRRLRPSRAAFAVAAFGMNPVVLFSSVGERAQRPAGRARGGGSVRAAAGAARAARRGARSRWARSSRSWPGCRCSCWSCGASRARPAGRRVRTLLTHAGAGGGDRVGVRRAVPQPRRPDARHVRARRSRGVARAVAVLPPPARRDLRRHARRARSGRVRAAAASRSVVVLARAVWRSARRDGGRSRGRGGARRRMGLVARCC